MFKNFYWFIDIYGEEIIDTMKESDKLKYHISKDNDLKGFKKVKFGKTPPILSIQLSRSKKSKNQYDGSFTYIKSWKQFPISQTLNVPTENNISPKGSQFSQEDESIIKK